MRPRNSLMCIWWSLLIQSSPSGKSGARTSPRNRDCDVAIVITTLSLSLQSVVVPRRVSSYHRMAHLSRLQHNKKIVDKIGYRRNGRYLKSPLRCCSFAREEPIDISNSLCRKNSHLLMSNVLYSLHTLNLFLCCEHILSEGQAASIAKKDVDSRLPRQRTASAPNATRIMPRQSKTTPGQPARSSAKPGRIAPMLPPE